MSKTKTFKFVDGEKEIHVGMKCYVSNVNHRSTYIDRPESVITKIGNKIITIDDSVKFYMNGEEKSDFSHNTVYSNKQAYIEKIERAKKTRTIINFLGYQNLSKEDFETIYNIVKKHVKEWYGINWTKIGKLIKWVNERY